MGWKDGENVTSLFRDEYFKGLMFFVRQCRAGVGTSPNAARGLCRCGAGRQACSVESHLDGGWNKAQAVKWK